MTTTTTPEHIKTPLWTEFTAWITRDRPDLTRYLQQLIGMSLIGEVLAHTLPFLHGKGANGKSVLLETFRAVLGDYAIESKNDLLLTGPDQHPTELANLRGRRFVVMSEVNEGARFDEAKLKMLTGGDAIAARFMRQDFFTFTPTHSLWLLGNHKPEVHAGGDSFWRRLSLIPFDNTITVGERNENLKNELLEEAPGILQWAIDGCIDYLAGGLTVPAVVRNATTEYEHEEDPLGRFTEQRLNIGGGDIVRVRKSEVRAAYSAWCKQEHEREISSTAFGRAMKTRFGLGEAGKGHDHYTNVTLLAADDDETPERDPDDMWGRHR